MNDFFPKRHRRKIVDLNIVPILDMLTTVIFFLLLSTSFMEYTKLTVPPSSTSVITDPVAPPPILPKLLIYTISDSVRLRMVWSGTHPGETVESVKENKDDPTETRAAISKAASKMISAFSKKYPSEKSLQLGLGAKVPYQYLISGMDGVRESIADIVLISPSEVEARARGAQRDAQEHVE